MSTAGEHLDVSSIWTGAIAIEAGVMERREFLGGAAAGVVAGAATVGLRTAQAQTRPNAPGPGLAGRDHSHEGDSASHSLLPSDPALRVKAMETLLTEKGLIDPAAVDALIDQYEHKLDPKIGAAVVAKAWADPAFKKALMDDAPKALASVDVAGRNVIAVENTDKVHNVVVCTLCSCYPWSVLGLPPAWYKSEAYRSRVVREPRKVLAEFGVKLPDQVDIRVWDSTAETRYVVIPQRPKGSEAMSEAQLATLVTRDSMIGTGIPSFRHSGIPAV
jgi:nitrile hydratase subunit alpha